MVTTIQEVSILQAYVYGTGNNYVRALNAGQKTGYDNWQDAIEPLDENYNLTNPALSNDDFIQWENERIANITANNEAAESIAQDMFAFSLTRADIAVIAKINRLTVNAFFNNPPAISQMYSALVNQLAGTNLASPTLSYIEATTGLTNITGLTTDEDKRLAWNSATDFLTILALTWQARGQR